jgi:hypothetical protein
MSSETVIIGQPNPQVLRALLESVLNFLAVNQQPVEPVARPMTVETAELVTA